MTHRVLGRATTTTTAVVGQGIAQLSILDFVSSPALQSKLHCLLYQYCAYWRSFYNLIDQWIFSLFY